MRKLHTLILSGDLTPHDAESTDILSVIANFQPIVIKDDMSEGISLSEVHSIHQINNYSIERIICHLREVHFQTTDVDDIFAKHSDIHRACVALSQMERTRLLNNYYLNSLNLPGLKGLHNSLTALFQQLEKR